ncbi:MAG TPA: Ig-like domain-containing protein [Gemmatimonadaceae bacterium]|nr:Ig-like domain-containing protein [Gemmatimonadaceae bacterium]
MSFHARTAIVLCIAALGCGGGGGVAGPPPVASVSVTLGQSSVVIGASTTATATPKDAGGTVLSGRVISWSSDNGGVATVSATGVVTGAGTGTAHITATSEGQTGSAVVTVTLPPIATVAVSLAASTVVVGGTTQASATAKDANGVTLPGRVVSWLSDNSLVATVNSAGLVTAVAAGSANITATSEGHSGSAAVTVVSAAVGSVTVSIASSTIGVGRTTQATATTKDTNGNVVTGRSVTWSSNNTSIATVDANGLVTGVGTGSANITATSEGQSGSAGVAIAPQLGYGSSSEKIRVVNVGAVFTPTLTGSSAGTTAFVSRATSVATVDAQGTITGVGPGQVWVAANSAGWVGDSVYVIVPRTSTGPVLVTDLTTFNVKPGAPFSFNVILDTRSTPIGGAELSVGYTTSPTLFQPGGNYTPTGTPAPVVSNLQGGVLRVSLASGSPLTGQLSILHITFTTVTSNTSGFLTLTFIDLVDPTGADLIPVATSTRIPVIVHD